MDLYKEYGSINILYEIKLNELHSFIIKFYDKIRMQKEWDLYLIHIQNGEQRSFEEWRTPIQEVKKESKESEFKKSDKAEK